MLQHSSWPTVNGSVSLGSIIDLHSLNTVILLSLNLFTTTICQSVFYYLICKNIIGDFGSKLCSNLEKEF